jgi:glycine cleavage system H protein
MVEIPSDLKYTESHEWIRINGDIGTVGITDFAQEQLGDIVFVELPGVGTKVDQFAEAGNIESAKAVGELKSPVSGEITAVNGDLEGAPEKINASPYGEGWIYKIKLADKGEVSKLLSADVYKTKMH